MLSVGENETLKDDKSNPSKGRTGFLAYCGYLSYFHGNNRDRIVGNLLRSGIDPTLAFKEEEPLTQALQKRVSDKLNLVPPAYAIFIVNCFLEYHYSFREENIKTKETHVRNKTSTFERYKCSNCQRCWGFNIHSIIEYKDLKGEYSDEFHSKRMLKLHPCEHVICSECFWEESVIIGSKFDEIRCPCDSCQAVLKQKKISTPKFRRKQQLTPLSEMDTIFERITKNENSEMIDVVPKDQSSLYSMLLNEKKDLFSYIGDSTLYKKYISEGHISPSTIKEVSFRKYNNLCYDKESRYRRDQSLKATSIDENEFRKSKEQLNRHLQFMFEEEMDRKIGRVTFSEAMDISTLAYSLPGLTQLQRSKELHRAAVEGFPQRIYALADLGIDINVPNEYGCPPLFEAIWMGHKETIIALLQCGAECSSSLTDHSGLTAFDVAQSYDQDIARKACIVPLLRHFLSNKDMGNIEQERKGGVQFRNEWEIISPTSSFSLYPPLSTEDVLRESKLSVIIPPTHPQYIGKGSYIIDNALTEEFLQRCESLFYEKMQPFVQYSCKERAKDPDSACTNRAYFLDMTGNFIVKRMKKILQEYFPHELYVNDSSRRDDFGSSYSQHEFSLEGSETESDLIDSESSSASNKPSTLPKFCQNLFPYLRFIHYTVNGACAPPHVDLTKTNSFYKYDLLEKDIDKSNRKRKILEEKVDGLSANLNDDCREYEFQASFVHDAKSTHTFILYLTTCEEAGETAFLKEIPKSAKKQNAKRKTDDVKNSSSKIEKDVNETSTTESKDQVIQTEVDRNNPQKEKEIENVIYAVKPVRGRILFFPHLAPHEGRKVCIPEHSGKSKLLLRGELY